MDTEGKISLFKTVPPNIVQSIRAFRVTELQQEAAHLQQHFLYAYCAEAVTKQQVLTTIATAFQFPRHFGASGRSGDRFCVKGFAVRCCLDAILAGQWTHHSHQC